MEYDIKYVAIYLRKSRGEDEDLAKHESVLVSMCDKNKWKYIQFREIGTSDSINLRPQFQKLLNDIENDLFDAVLVMDYDRLSRGDMGQQDLIKKTLRKSNTLIITPQKVYDLNNDIDDTYTDFQGLLARQEYKMIKKRMTQGKKIGAKMGNWTNGIPPFGYVYQSYKDKFNEKGLVVHEEELLIYRYIIDRALEGVSPHNIAYDLNRQSVKTRKGKSWSNVAIYRILTNETYLGRIVSNKTKGNGHKHKDSFVQRIDKKDWVVVENCHEAIITQIEFYKIQNIINKRLLIPPASRSNKAEWTGILRCGVCGASLQVQKGKNIIKPCQHKDELGNKCINRGMKFELIYEEIKKVILLQKETILNNIGKDNTEDINNITNNLQSKYLEIKKYENALLRVQEAFELGDYNREQFKQRKENWETKIDQVEESIHILEKELKAQKTITSEEKLAIINYYLDNIDKIEDVSKRNQFHKTVFDSIIFKRIGDEESDLTINFL